MSKYRRYRHGRVLFFTVVTNRRRPILTTELGRSCLRDAFQSVRRQFPFGMPAVVLLPEHLHTIWQLPNENIDYSRRWSVIKGAFSKLWVSRGGPTMPRSTNQRRRGELGLWQRRFFEHTIRDERDFKRCVDYIHVNPLKHGLVECVKDWPWSSFHRYLREGEYDPNWGSANVWYGDEFKHFE